MLKSITCGTACIALWLATARPAAAHGAIHERLDHVSSQIAASPDNADLYLQRADLFRQHQEWKPALADCKTAAKLDPEIEADALAGRIWLESGPVHGALTSSFRTLSNIPLPEPTAADGKLRLRLESFNDTESQNEATGIDTILISGTPASKVTAGEHTKQAIAASPTSPPNGKTDIGKSTTLTVNVTNPDKTPLTVTFYGRKTTPAKPGPDFTLVTLPDTQHYSENADGKRGDTFHAQTRWIVDQRKALNIAFVSHMGDIVQNGDFGGNPAEWEIADTAMRRIENPQTTLLSHGIPWGAAPGNHDQNPAGDAAGATRFFNEYFGSSSDGIPSSRISKGTSAKTTCGVPIKRASHKIHAAANGISTSLGTQSFGLNAPMLRSPTHEGLRDPAILCARSLSQTSAVVMTLFPKAECLIELNLFDELVSRIEKTFDRLAERNRGQ